LLELLALTIIPRFALLPSLPPVLPHSLETDRQGFGPRSPRRGRAGGREGRRGDEAGKEEETEVVLVLEKGKKRLVERACFFLL